MVFVTGATGFVGNHVVKTLLAFGEKVRCLVRPGSEGRLRYAAEIVKGDIFSPDLAAKMAGCKAVIHLVGIIREFPQKGITFKRLHVEATARTLAAAKRAGIKKFIHMSALGSSPEAETSYHQTKFQAEELVRRSGLAYTIFRPSVIYGPYDQFTTMLAKIIKISPVIPIVGDGLYKLQPVHVHTVALGFTLALYLPTACNQIFEIGGPKALTYREIVDNIALRLKRKKRKVFLPVKPIKFITAYAQHFSFYPLTEEILTMLLAGNVTTEGNFYRVFSLTPIKFQEGTGYLK
ncbi:MAG: NAD(P)H-binding protein [Candidatus Desulfofervidaceae bacterium]|nr:NAD(P)H-binding protein [Candidatus Desulfofervidaceae bacterium]